MINANINIIGSSPTSGFDTITSNLVKQWNIDNVTKPSSSVINEYDLFLKNLRSVNLISRNKTLNIYGFGSIEAGTYNITSPTTYKHTPVLSPIFTEGSGVKSNGTTSYINTNYKVNEFIGIETGVTIIIYVSESSTDIATTRAVFGARAHAESSTTPHRIQPLLTSSTGNRSNYATSDNFSNTDHKGLYILTYNGTQSILYKDYDGISGIKDIQTVTPVSPNLTINEIFLAHNSTITPNSITPTLFYNKNSALLCRFDRFNDVDAINFKSKWDRFRGGVGLMISFLPTQTWSWDSTEILFNSN
jgi:hypothetical protein